MRPGVLTMEAQDSEQLAFSDMTKAEAWLKDNGFYLGRRPWFNYKNDYQEWCHTGEKSWDFVDVAVESFEVDEMEESQYKDFHFDPAPWHEK